MYAYICSGCQQELTDDDLLPLSKYRLRKLRKAGELRDGEDPVGLCPDEDCGASVYESSSSYYCWKCGVEEHEQHLEGCSYRCEFCEECGEDLTEEDHAADCSLRDEEEDDDDDGEEVGAGERAL